jgi:5-(carboxyamino)imidazole ribonucleotide synthase
MNPGSDTWIGVLGGGQLGRMLALEARRMGFKVLKWTGGDVSGAAYTADQVMESSFEDPTALEKFLKRVDVVTVEFENVPLNLLETIESQLPLMPGSKAVAICQHREREKNFLSTNGFPCARYTTVENVVELRCALTTLGTDLILKTAEFGYDGKGQCNVPSGSSDEMLRKIWSNFDCNRAIIEERINLDAEFSVIIARSQDGNTETFDPCENQHRNHILDVSILPARMHAETLQEALEIAAKIADAMDYVGVLAVEFFLTKEGRLLVNELAPRPHNSGHHSLDACETSQFEQQLRAISGLPLGSPRLLQPAVMWNLLGDLWLDPTTPPDWTPLLATPGASLHLYGKSEARPGRKMGHVTFVAKTREEALQRASKCRLQFGYPCIE